MTIKRTDTKAEAMHAFNVEVKSPWWGPLYLHTVFFLHLIGFKIDLQKCLDFYISKMKTVRHPPKK